MMIQNLSALLAIGIAYVFLQGYFFNLGYFYSISGFEINPYLGFYDIVNTSSSAVIFFTLYLMTNLFINSYKSSLKSTSWLAAIFFLIMLTPDIYRAIRDSEFSSILLFAILLFIIVILLVELPRIFKKSNFKPSHIGMGMVALLMIPASMIGGFQSFKQQSKSKYNLYISNYTKPVTVTNFRNLETGFFGIDKNGRPKVFSKTVVNSFEQLEKEAVK